LLKLSIQLPIKSTLITVLLLFIVSQVPAWIASQSLFRIMTINSSEMSPTLNPGDCVMIRLTRPNQYRPRRNDLVSFAIKSPTIAKEAWQISRIVGLPGDSLSIKTGLILINNQIVGINSSAIKNSSNKQYTIPEGLSFCLGDKPELSIDSRQLGLLPLDSVNGFVQLILFPGFPRFFTFEGFFQSPSPPPEILPDLLPGQASH